MKAIKIYLFVFSLVFASCKTQKTGEPKVDTSLVNVPAQRLNYRFETDVPAPSNIPPDMPEMGRDEKVQADFDSNRPFDVLDRTYASPNKQRILAVYRSGEDLEREYRLDVYDANGKLIKKITHEQMAVHFPGTIVWAPDSKNVAFVAMVRGYDPEGKAKKPESTGTQTSSPNPGEDANSNLDDANSGNSNANVSVDPNDPNAPKMDVMTFRTEQIYLSNADGGDVKPLTQTDGLVYFYMNWAPDSTALAALATPITEWKVREMQAAQSGEVFTPSGRLRLLETNGRERLLDDYSTPVHPVWSPDSAKVAIAFDKEVRVYDTVGDRPTQAAIPLRNQLLVAAKNYEATAQKEELNANVNTNSDAANESKEKKTNSNANANANVQLPSTTLPDEANLVAFNPIINLVWDQDTLLYLETGYVKNYVEKEAENRRSFLRWHRLILSAQPSGPTPQRKN